MNLWHRYKLERLAVRQRRTSVNFYYDQEKGGFRLTARGTKPGWLTLWWVLTKWLFFSREPELILNLIHNRNPYDPKAVTFTRLDRFRSNEPIKAV